MRLSPRLPGSQNQDIVDNLRHAHSLVEQLDGQHEMHMLRAFWRRANVQTDPDGPRKASFEKIHQATKSSRGDRELDCDWSCAILLHTSAILAQAERIAANPLRNEAMTKPHCPD